MKFYKTFGAVLFAILLIGCAPLAMYRTDIGGICSASTPARLHSACARNAVQVLKPTSVDLPAYMMGFIEFDDQGQLWDRAQMAEVLKSVDSETSNGSNDYLKVVFVHGWKHNASEDDDNVSSFRATLLRLSATELAESRRIGEPARRVIGIYIGWRGESVDVPFIDNVTFWDRKDTAHKVGHGQVTEVLERLEAIRQLQLARIRDVAVGWSSSDIALAGRLYSPRSSRSSSRTSCRQSHRKTLRERCMDSVTWLC